MKRLISLLAFVTAVLTLNAQNSDGVLGFANVSDLGCQGVTGGMDGRIVHVKTHDDLVKFCKASEPLTIIIDNSISGHWVKGLNGAPSLLDEISVTSDKTIMAASPEVKLDSMCFDIKNQRNIVFRNITLTAGKPDGMAFRNCHHVWVDHCDLSTCDDGLLDFTLGSSYGTISWSAFHDHDKVSLSCSGTMHYEDVGKNRVSYHHNHYYNGTQRNPRIGYGLGHLWNNYWNHNTYEGSAGYCVGYFNGARVLVENGYFTDVKNPFQNMYGVYDYDSSWAHLESRRNLFGSGVSGDRNGTSESFDPTKYYDYDFAMQPAAFTRDEMLAQVGPQAWVPYDVYGFPGNGAINISNLKQLKWSPVENAERYELWFGTDAENLALVQSNSKRVYSLPALDPSTTYYWKVRTFLTDGSSKARTFLTGEPPTEHPPVLGASAAEPQPLESALFRFTTGGGKAAQPEPADGAEDYAVYAAYPHDGVTQETCGGFATEAGRLSWMAAVDAREYRVWLGTAADAMELAGTVRTSSFQPSEPLRLATPYYWRVDAVKEDGTIVEGDVWTFTSKQKLIGEGKTECEDMLMFGQTFLELENGKVNWMYKASNDWVTTGEAGTGTLAGTYDGRDAICKVDFCYFDEKQGQGTYQLRVNNRKVGSFVANKNTNKLATQSFSNIELHRGDQLACDFLMKDKMKCRFDYINITVVEELTAISQPTLDSPANGQSYNISGQKVSDDYKGIIIKNGKKILRKIY